MMYLASNQTVFAHIEFIIHHVIDGKKVLVYDGKNSIKLVIRCATGLRMFHLVR